MPMNSTESPVNLLTGSHVDPVTHTPAYKETAVQMQILEPKGEIPLPRINPRFGRPTPQQGVEVERKWRRPDYQFPGNALGSDQDPIGGLTQMAQPISILPPRQDGAGADRHFARCAASAR